jgi:putative membrane protein
MYLILRWLLNAFALWLTTEIIPGISFTQPGLGPILIAALVLGLVNAIVRPVMILLTLPLTIVTLGLFLLVVNALALGIVIALTPMATTGFGTTMLAALVLTIIGTALNALIGKGREREL